MKIAVFGVGAVGSYFGGRLAQAGEEVVFLARGENLKALLEKGLRVESVSGDFEIQPVVASDDPAQIGAVDAILLGVKAWQVTEAATAIRPLVGPETFIVPLQNGVEAPQQLSSVIGEEHVLGGLCRIASAVVAPGHIRHTGLEPFVAFGELDNHSSERSQRLLETFQRAGVKSEIPADIRAAMWEKFLFIASFSGVGAVTRAPAGVIRSVPETRQMLVEALREVAVVANAHRVNLPAGVATRTLAFIDGIPAQTIASMQRDILEGRPSELESQNGAVMRLGQETQVLTPVHTFIYHSLLPMEMRARRMIEF